MTAGRRDQLVTLQRFTATQDDYGEEVQSWTDLASEWAAVFYGRGDERRQAAQDQIQQAINFQMLANQITLGLKIEDRVILDGAVWNIVGVSPHTPKRGLVEVTATATGLFEEVPES